MEGSEISQTKKRIGGMCKDLDLDFFGVAPVSRFDEAPEIHQPRAVLRGAKSVISIGLKIPEGVSEANRTAFEGKNMEHSIHIYQMHGYELINRKLNDSVFSISKYLENEGFKSTPIPASKPMNTEKLEGVFSNRHAAVAAGLAKFGWNTLAVTEEAGPRVRWASVLTTADLPPDEMLEDETCNRCMSCAEACPMNAISEEESVELEIGGKRFEYSKLQKWLCLIGGVYGISNQSFTRTQYDVPKNPTSSDYLKALEHVDEWDDKERITSLCGRCIIECPVGRKTV